MLNKMCVCVYARKRDLNSHGEEEKEIYILTGRDREPRCTINSGLGRLSVCWLKWVDDWGQFLWSRWNEIMLKRIVRCRPYLHYFPEALGLGINNTKIKQVLTRRCRSRKKIEITGPISQIPIHENVQKSTRKSTDKSEKNYFRERQPLLSIKFIMIYYA